MDKNEDSEKAPLISTETSIQTIAKERIKWPKPIALLLEFRHKFILAAEPVMLLFTFGIILQNSVYQQYFYNRYGRQLFREELNWTGGFNFCMNADVLDSFLGNGTHKIVTQKSSYLSLVNGVAGLLPGIIATLLYGPLSDRIGRKPIMIVIGIAGIANSTLTILLMYADWPMEILPAINAINGLVGGFPGMLTVVFAYTADISSKQWLTLRLGVMEAMIFIGGALAVLLNGQWLNATNCMFPGPEYLYLGSSILMIIYVVTWLPESFTSHQRKERRQNASLLKVATRGLKLFFSKEYSAWKLWLGVGAMFIGYFLTLGNAEISTLFLLGPPLIWNPALIGLYQAMTQGVFGLALFSLLPLLVMLKVPDPVILLLGFAWAAGASVATTFVQVTWQMFLGELVLNYEQSNYYILYSWSIGGNWWTWVPSNSQHHVQNCGSQRSRLEICVMSLFMTIYRC